jgi:hypothetical protein
LASNCVPTGLGIGVAEGVTEYSDEDVVAGVAEDVAELDVVKVAG